MAIDQLDTLKEYTIPDANWHQVNDLFADTTSALTIKNLSGTTVSVFSTSDQTLTADTVDDHLALTGKNPPEVGGINYEISSLPNQKVFVKSVDGSGKISVRIFGTVDPSVDLSEISKMLTDVSIQLDNHKKDTKNPHVVDKEQVELGNIPNAVTSDPLDPNYDKDTDINVLVSLRGLRNVLAVVMDHINTVKGNPHGVTKSDTELGNVADYPPATEKQAIDQNNDSTYLTPHTGSLLVKDMVQVALSVKPQTVVAGQIGARLPGWSMYDITVPPNTVVQSGDRGFVINSQLQVAYAYQGKVLMSKILGQPINGLFAPTMPDGIHYLYVDLDEKGNFTNYGVTQYCPISGIYREASQGDFFNTATCEMTTHSGDQLRRVYLAKAYFSSNKLLQLVCVPFGDTAIVPILNPIPLGKSALLVNPFISKVSTTAYVEYNSKWGESKWNDQTGVIANPKPNDEYNNILVQVGQIGYLTAGASAGSPFGESFQTITSPIRMTVKVKLEA